MLSSSEIDEGFHSSLYDSWLSPQLEVPHTHRCAQGLDLFTGAKRRIA